MSQNTSGWTLVFARSDLRRRLRCLRHLDGMASDALKFGDAVRGPSAAVAEGEHWATIVRRVAVRSPSWAFPPRLPGGRTAAGPFFASRTAWLTADAGYRSGAEEHEPDEAEDQHR